MTSVRAKSKGTDLETQVAMLEEERDDLKRRKAGTEEMLAQVLISVGEPVIVPLEQMKANLTGLMIDIQYNEEEEAYIFSMVEVDE